MILSLIYAVAENRVIGAGGKMPWRLPDDFKHFKSTTMGHPVIMGRVTFESDTGLLPGRDNIVLSRDENVRKNVVEQGGKAYSSLGEALNPFIWTDKEVFIIGGAKTYDSAFEYVRGGQKWLSKKSMENSLFSDTTPQFRLRIYETLVHASPSGDTRLKDFDLTKFRLVRPEQFHPADDRHAFAFTIRVWERK